MPLSISLNLTPAKALTRYLDNLSRNTATAIRGAFEESAIEQVQVVDNRLPARHVRLKRSLQVSRADLTRRVPVIRIGSPLAWAAITHFGGTVRTFEARGLTPTPDAARRRVFGSKPLKYLTVPLTRFGTPKFARARDYQQVFVFKSKKTGKLYLAQRLTTVSDRKTKKEKTGFAGRLSRKLVRPKRMQKKAGFRLLFALVERTVIQASPYLFWSGEDRARTGRILIRHLSEAAREG